MTISDDKRFIIKELSKGDHKSLLTVMERYVTHLTSGPSMLCVNLLHFETISMTDAKSGKN